MLAGVASGGVYRSTDGGVTWKPPAPTTAWLRSESVWSLGSFKDRPDLRGDPERHLRLDRLRLQLDADQRRHLGHRPCAPSPTTSSRTSTTRPAPTACSARSTPGCTWSTSQALGKQLGDGQVRDSRSSAASTRSASTPPPRTACTPAARASAPFPGPATWRKVATDGLWQQHDLLGARQLCQPPARSSPARSPTAATAGVRAARLGRRRQPTDQAAVTTRPRRRQLAVNYQRHLVRHADDRVRLPVAGLHRRLPRHRGRDQVRRS